MMRGCQAGDNIQEADSPRRTVAHFEESGGRQKDANPYVDRDLFGGSPRIPL